MRVVVLHPLPSLKFVGLAVRKIWCTMCVSINGRGGNRETCVQVGSKVGNLPSKFVHARPLGSRIIRYVRDGRTYRRTDGTILPILVILRLLHMLYIGLFSNPSRSESPTLSRNVHSSTAGCL